MSNNKFHFELKKKTPKISDFFPLHSKKKLQSYHLCSKKKKEITVTAYL